MSYTELTEVKTYLDHIRGEPDYKSLYDIEADNFVDVGRDPQNSDWHDYPGTEVLQDLWLDATEPQRQAQLGYVSHLRAKAWKAVFDEVFGSQQD